MTTYTVSKTELSGVLLLEPQIFNGDQEIFFESFNLRELIQATGLDLNFVQDNHSKSYKGVLRGLHYQIQRPQGKLVRVVNGSVFDVVVDLRRSSPSFGKWLGIHLSAENRRQVWIPPGFAHGFIVTSEFAEFVYKTTDYWFPEYERTLLWCDPSIGVAWPIDGVPKLAAKDVLGKTLADADVYD